MPPSWEVLEPGLKRLYLESRFADLAEALRTLAPDPAWEARARTLHGCALAALGRDAEALEAFSRAAGLAPSDARAQANLGQALLGAGRTEEAGRRLRHARDLDPGDLRHDRLLLQAGSADWSGWLPMTAGASRGHLLPRFQTSDAAPEPGVALLGDRAGTWTLRVEDGLPLPPTGIPVLAAVWNEAGLHLKGGTLSVLDPGKVVAVTGPDAKRVQRRNHLRVLAGEFVRAERGDGLALDLLDVSAGGLSFFGEAREGDRADFNVVLKPLVLRTPGVVRGTRTARSGKRVTAVRFLTDSRTQDRLAFALQEHRRRLRQPAARPS